MKKVRITDVFKAAYFECTKDTKQQYNNQLKKFALFIYVDRKTITRPDIIKAFSWLLESCSKGQVNLILKEYTTYLTKQKLSKYTINRYVANVGAIIEAAFEIGFIDWTPPKVRPFKVSTTPTKDTSGPSFEAVLEIIEQAKKGWGMNNKRNPAILSLMLYMGLRACEICRLKYGDIDLKNKTIAVLGKMRETPETFIIPDACIDPLKYYIKHRDKRKNELFRAICYHKRTLKTQELSHIDIYNMVAKVSSKAGHPTTPHAIRHTALTTAAKHMGEKNLGVDYLLKFSRHTSLTHLSRYLDTTREHKQTIANLIKTKEDEPTKQEAQAPDSEAMPTKEQYNLMMKQLAEINEKLSNQN